MLKHYSKLLIVVGTGILLSCKSLYPTTETAQLYKIKEIAFDSSIVHYYKPYKDSLDKIMELPLAELEEDLSKNLPESTLGNMMADILRTKTEQYTGKKMDIGILNYGGIRISSLSKGTLKVIHAYNLMPFDNYLVTQELTGQQVQDFCDSIAQKKGWPVSGISFKIKNGRATDIAVQGVALDLNIKYQVALSDYLAGGGDDMAFLKKIPNQNTGKLFRDAIIEYWKEQQAEGKKIDAHLENRIIYVE